MVLVKWNQEKKMREWRDEQLDRAHWLFKNETQKRIKDEEVAEMYARVEWNEEMEKIASNKGYRNRYFNIFKF